MRNPITKSFLVYGMAFLGLLATIVAGHAAQPVDWQLWHQPAASVQMEEIISFDILTFWIITPITLFVTVLLAYVMIRFRASANPTPSKTTHNTAIEVVWTIGPVLILLVLAIPSFKLLTNQFNPPEPPAVTIKATGYQWYWGFEYQGEREIAFETRLIGRDEDGTPEGLAKADEERAIYGKTDRSKYPRLLAVDNEVVVPVGKVVRVLVTAGDVIHNFAVPALGKKLDGIPGRLNETFFQATKEGLYYGQCSELCGRDHAFMPLAVRVVSEEQYAAWISKAAGDLDGANKDLIASIEDAKKSVKVAGN